MSLDDSMPSSRELEILGSICYDGTSELVTSEVFRHRNEAFELSNRDYSNLKPYLFDYQTLTI